MSFFVSGLVVDNGSLSIGPAGDDGNGPGLAQRTSQTVGVISFVSKDVAGVGSAGEQGRSDGDVGDVSWCQDQGEGTSDDVGEGVNLGRLATARRADALRPGPPFPPKAERCALT